VNRDAPWAPPGVGAARRRRWFEFKRPIGLAAALALGAAIWVIFFGFWDLVARVG